MVYHGKAGDYALQYFSDNGNTDYAYSTTYIIWYVAGYECEQHDNPADFYLDVVISCETLEMKGMINYYLLLKL